MEVVFVSSPDGDWEGLYIDGKLVDQGHSLNPHSVAEKILLRIPGNVVDTKEAAQDWLETEGYLPENLSEVVYANS
jgi:hypothetical protein